MIYLNTNQMNQALYLTLDEARQYFPTAFTHYLFILRRDENSPAGVSLSQVLNVVDESQRITHALIATTGLTLPGRYRYTVYGQNSAVNTNPTDASVVGICEIGLATLSNGDTFYDVPDITINNDIVFNG